MRVSLPQDRYRTVGIRSIYVSLIFIMPPATQQNVPSPDAFILFEGAIDKDATQKLANAIITFVNANVPKITILFSSLGGSVYDGFLLATMIQNARIPVAIHATNHVDSIGNVIFLSAKQRSSESHAKFYFHSTTVQGNFDEKGLREKLSELKTQNSRTAYFVSENTPIALKKIQEMMKRGVTLSAQDALKYGIISEIKHLEIPATALRNEIIYVN